MFRFARLGLATTVAAPRRLASTSVARTYTENTPSTFASVKDTMTKEAFHEYEHAAKSTGTWFYLNFLVTIPGLVAVCYFCVPTELEHLRHLLEHPREFEDLPYMRKRKNPFPWGDNSLFHNDNANPVESSLFLAYLNSVCSC
ncbi:cytochrome c oxidase subunit VIa-domain-containing protein [Chytriomyces sp. MP71]|nr:cytochrome c oxidase subunit VIa-domain-containing protein [Chytriomyces sp. MP71]